MRVCADYQEDVRAAEVEHADLEEIAEASDLYRLNRMISKLQHVQFVVVLLLPRTRMLSTTARAALTRAFLARDFLQCT